MSRRAKTILQLVALGAGLLGFLAYVLIGAPDSGWRLSLHGWIALVAGSVLTIGLAVGLMALMFHSSRRGYDERVRDLQADKPD
jgi:hypothetical protein